MASAGPGKSTTDFAGQPFTREQPTNQAKEFWGQVGEQEGGGGGTVHSWHNETRTDDFQQLPKAEPPHATIVIKNSSYWNGEYKDSLKRNRFQSKLKHNLDNWARCVCLPRAQPPPRRHTSRRSATVLCASASARPWALHDFIGGSAALTASESVPLTPGGAASRLQRPGAPAASA